MLQAGIYCNTAYALGSEIYANKSKYCISVSSSDNIYKKFERYILCRDICLLAGISRIGNSYEE
jgi:hypothetical protein